MGLLKHCASFGAVSSAAVVCVLSTPTVSAQEAGLVLEEITVTARKREENL